MPLFSLWVIMGILEKLPIDNFGTQLKNKNTEILPAFQTSKHAYFSMALNKSTGRTQNDNDTG